MNKHLYYLLVFCSLPILCQEGTRKKIKVLLENHTAEICTVKTLEGGCDTILDSKSRKFIETYGNDFLWVVDPRSSERQCEISLTPKTSIVTIHKVFNWWSMRKKEKKE